MKERLLSGAVTFMKQHDEQLQRSINNVVVNGACHFDNLCCYCKAR